MNLISVGLAQVPVGEDTRPGGEGRGGGGGRH